MNDQAKYTRKTASQMLAQYHPGFDRNVESDQAASGGFRPPEFAGQHLYGVNELVALDYQLTLRREGWTVKLAGSLATRLHEAMAELGNAEIIALVKLENGNRLATADICIEQIQIGETSGQQIREVLIVHVGNLKRRISRMMAEAALLVGDDNE